MLTSNNYERWRVGIRFMLMAQGVLGILDGTDTAPAASEAEKEKRLYNQRKMKAQGIICRSVSVELRSIVANTTSAKEAWDALAAVFRPASRALKAKMRREFLRLKLHPDEEMAVFLARVDKMAAELKDELKVSLTNEDIAYQYLDELPPEYEYTVQQIYHWSDADFTTAKVKEQLLAEYSRQKLKKVEHEGQDVAYPQENTAKVFSSQQSHYSQETPGNRKAGAYGVKCYNCGGNHFQRHCPHLPVAQHPVQRGDSSPASRSHNQRGRGRGKRGSRKVASYLDQGAFYVQRPVSQDDSSPKGLGCAALSQLDIEFIVDSGATDHVCRHEHWFTKLEKTSNISVSLGEGKSKVTGIGQVDLGSWLTIELRGLH